MRYFVRTLVGGVAVLLTQACGVQSAVDNIQDAAAAAAKQERGEKGFEAAVSTVTQTVMSAVGDAMSEAMTPATAPAFSPSHFRKSASSQGSMDVNTSAQAYGGTVAVKGKIDWDIESSGSDATIDETFDLTATWSDLKIPVDGKTYASTGTEKISGSIHVVVSGNSVAMTGTIKETGDFTLGQDKYTFDVSVDLATKSYSGTVNGNAVSGSVETTTDDPNDDSNVTNGNTSHGTADAAGKSCDIPATSSCYDYTGSYYSASTVASQCQSPAVQVTSCDTTGRVSHCVVGGGTAYEYTISYYNSANNGQTYCSQVSGAWSAN